MGRIIVPGCTGRMGRRIATLAFQHPQLSVGGATEVPNHSLLGADIGEVVGMGPRGVRITADMKALLHKGDVIIDFTSPQATIAHIKYAVEKNTKIVIGTTGLTAKDHAVIKKAAQKIAIVCAPNMSVGVNLLFRLSQMVGRILSDEYDVEIVEAHHKHKKDAPSGTALELARQIALGRGVSLEKEAVYGREGITGKRKRGAIGIHAVRGGDVVGEHTVSFLADGERVELVHKASSRDAFAKGSLVAALFLQRKKTGLYSMQDVLGV